ncbi:MAG: hypothetical protein ABWZ42_02380 [Ilumatobacteraceae bacterium]
MDDEASPSTVTDALAMLYRRGYTADFELIDGVLRSGRGDVACAVDQAVVEHLYRFEGPSDPGDEMIVFAVRDPATGTAGTLAAAFGPSGDPELHEHLAGLRTRFG